jgi:thiamine-monophosphate kinase
MAETVHFLRETMAPEEIGWKLLASNVSDVAAMGGQPVYALLTAAISPEWTEEELRQMYDGLYRCADKAGVTLIGGDTVRSPGGLILSLTMVGEVEQGKALTRSSARSGDVVFVTGTLGDSAAGLHLLLHHPEWRKRFPRLVAAHCLPEPQLAVGRWLAGSGFSPACDDISDGIAQEAWEIAEASGVILVLEEECIPVSDEVREYAELMGMDPMEWALCGGEDYQLIGTITQEGWKALKREAERSGWPITAIGRVKEGGPAVELISGSKRMPLPRNGYNHFANRTKR